MQVDHIIPEHLLDDSIRLDAVLREFGLPPTFDLNSFENWMPSCPAHNNQKRDAVFEPTPIIQKVLQDAAKKAELARRTAARVITNKRIERAISEILIALEDEPGPTTLEIVKAGVIQIRGALLVLDPMVKSASTSRPGDMAYLEGLDLGTGRIGRPMASLKQRLQANILVTPSIRLKVENEDLRVTFRVNG